MVSTLDTEYKNRIPYTVNSIRYSVQNSVFDAKLLGLCHELGIKSLSYSDLFVTG